MVDALSPVPGTASPDGARPGGQHGVTQIEVLVGIVLTATLVVGLIGLWNLVDTQFIRLQWRQMAVFELNAQTERIAALYRYTDFAEQEKTHGDDKDSEGRWIFRGNPGYGINALVVSETKDSDVTEASFGARQILFMNYPGKPNSSAERNVIWLDRARRVTAELSWTLDKAGLANCWKDSCYRVTVALTYPYRLVDGTGSLEADLGDTETLTLQTLVGRRGNAY